jgi:membrane associated rhomboid family serine protease
MIPIKDDIPSSRFPAVNTAIISANCLAFVLELSLGNQAGAFIQSYGIVPQRLLQNLGGEWWTIFSSMFLHGGWAHIIGNMLYLYIFGDNVEDAMGHVPYLIFYLMCGTGAAWAQVLSGPGSSVPTVGASGAIAGVLGAYLVLYPRAGVLTLIPLGFFLQVVRIPALLVLGFWIVIQFISGLASIPQAGSATGGVAWFAHIGGVAAGLVLVKLFVGRRLTRR